MRTTINTGMWGLWSPEITGVGWVAGTLGLSLRDAKIALAGREANGDAFPSECCRELALDVVIGDDGRVSGVALAAGLVNPDDDRRL